MESGDAHDDDYSIEVNAAIVITQYTKKGKGSLEAFQQMTTGFLMGVK